jgi:hypothetical protein
MKTTLMVVMLALSSYFVAQPAQAATVSECQAVIAALIADTQGATSLSSKDEAGLVGKAQNASIKLDQAKFAASLQKLRDYDNALNALRSATKPKIGEGDYETLSADAAAAIGCVQELIDSI